MGCLYALLGFDLLAWTGLTIVGGGTIRYQGGIHAPYYFFLPMKVVAAVLGVIVILALAARLPRIRPIAGPIGALVGLAALVALPIFLMFYTGGI